ncbi:hypothetical protein GF325_03420 [Candidatus Bathyarchaeota archaeon]|nr:hypothetical protein [Candidatus Bathyarchaeota archaeon]
MIVERNHGRLGDNLQQGIILAPHVLIIIFLVPRIVHEFFSAGLAGITLVITIAIIPGCFLAMFLAFFPHERMVKVSLVFTVTNAFLVPLAGYISWLGVDPDSFQAVLVLGITMLCVFASLMLDLLTWVNHQAASGTLPTHQMSHNSYSWWEYIICTCVALLLGFSTSSLFELEPLLYACVSVFLAIGIPERARRLLYTRESFKKHKRKPLGIRWKRSSTVPLPRSTRRLKPLQVMSNLLIFFMGLIFMSTGWLGLESRWGMIWIVGFLLGLLFFGLNPVRRRSRALGSSTLMMVLYILVLSNTSYFTAWWMLLLTGIASGIAIGELAWIWNHDPPARKSRMALAIFLLVLLSSVSGGVGHELEYIMDNNPVYLLVGVLLILISVVFSIPVTVHGDYMASVASQGRRKWNKLFNKSQRTRPGLKKLKIAPIVVMISSPVFLGVLFAETNFNVKINIPTQAYDVHGNPVTSISLAPTTGKILLKDLGFSGAPHGEIIRPGKSIRLGGYYYGYGEDITETDAINWIATTNDVFSLGTCGAITTPADIMAIKTINPLARFYYMAFATSLEEDPASPYSNGSWGNTHYPRVRFNETMHDWTVKLNNGTEAVGVRRDSNSSPWHLMDLGNDEWAEYFAKIYENRAILYHADGVAIDEVMWRGYWDTSVGELADYSTVEQITETCYDWLERVDSTMSVEIITQAFWQEAQVYQQGVWGELAFRAGDQARESGPYGGPVDDRKLQVFYESMNWKQIVENANLIARRNESYIWACWYEPGATRALEYGLATYLMAKPNNATNLVFQPHPGYYPRDGIVGYAISTVRDEINAYPEYFNIELGDALGSMRKVSGKGGTAWMREYENGYIYVNPNHLHLAGF